MAEYNLYAGLGGGFGGAVYVATEDFNSFEDAEARARELAVEEYESYEGMHGILSPNDIRESYCEDNELSEGDLGDEDDEAIMDMYTEEVEGWIAYKAVLASEDPDFDEEEN